MDETPLLYEYLPLKVEEKGKKNVATWKAGLEKKKCTVILAVTASGKLLEPGLILPRKIRYKLLQRNKLGIKILKPNAWIDSDIMISWPYVGENKSILILDSYAAHYSKEVRTHLTKNPNLKLALIPGSSTPILQSLYYNISASFKIYIKEKVRNIKLLAEERMLNSHPH